jgi:outer membrane biosynthesis protein TonB
VKPELEPEQGEDELDAELAAAEEDLRIAEEEQMLDNDREETVPPPPEQVPEPEPAAELEHVQEPAPEPADSHEDNDTEEEEEEEEKEDAGSGACSGYKLDMAGNIFGDCVCGFAKKDHSQESRDNYVASASMWLFKICCHFNRGLYSCLVCVAHVPVFVGI